jgi:hypothetical protein
MINYICYGNLQKHPIKVEIKDASNAMKHVISHPLFITTPNWGGAGKGGVC